MNSHGQTDGRLKRVVLFLELVFGAVAPIAIIVLIFWNYNSKQDLYGLSTIPSEELYDPGSTTMGRFFLLTGQTFPWVNAIRIRSLTDSIFDTWFEHVFPSHSDNISYY
jgi:hypothetical protein